MYADTTTYWDYVGRGSQQCRPGTPSSVLVDALDELMQEHAELRRSAAVHHGWARRSLTSPPGDADLHVQGRRRLLAQDLREVHALRLTPC